MKNILTLIKVIFLMKLILYTNQLISKIQHTELENDNINKNNDYIIITKDGLIEYYDQFNKEKWIIDIHQEIMNSNIIDKDFINQKNILIPMEGKLFYLTNNDEQDINEFTIPIIFLVNNSPFDFQYMPNHIFKGEK